MTLKEEVEQIFKEEQEKNYQLYDFDYELRLLEKIMEYAKEDYGY